MELEWESLPTPGRLKKYYQVEAHGCHYQELFFTRAKLKTIQNHYHFIF